MSGPMSPRLLKAGIVLTDPKSGQVQRIVTLQYNPDSLSRSLQAKTTGNDGDRSEALRLKGPPVEMITLEAEIDATDQLESNDSEGIASGIQPQLAALEVMVYPESTRLLANQEMASRGMLQIVPMESPLALFVWSKSRVMPVRITEFSITEEAFDTALNPIRATVSLTLRVLSVDDLGFSHKGGRLFMSYLATKESLSRRVTGGTLTELGLDRLP
jgi:hypothetical protein